MAKGSAALQTFLLNNQEFNRAYLISITLTNGQVLSVLFGTNLTKITYNAVDYWSTKFGAWELGDMSFEATFRPTTNNFTLTALLRTSDSLPIFYPGSATTMLQAVNAGLFNGATVSVQVLYWGIGAQPSSGFAQGTLPLQIGQIGNIVSTGRSKVEFECYDLLYLLNRPVPPHELQSPCRHTLFDFGCTLLKANFTSTNLTLSVQSTTLYLVPRIPTRLNTHGYLKGDLMVPAVNGIIWFANNNGTSAGAPPSFASNARGHQVTDGGVTWISMGQNNSNIYGYTQGWGVFTSGANNGVKFAIKLDNGFTTADAGPISTEQIQLIQPLPFAVAGGDTIQIFPGCDKTIDTCFNVYNNLIHFGGTPFVPNPEVAGATGG